MIAIALKAAISGAEHAAAVTSRVAERTETFREFSADTDVGVTAAIVLGLIFVAWIVTDIIRERLTGGNNV